MTSVTLDDLVLSRDQQDALDHITDWYTTRRAGRGSQYLTFGGYAGTGKTSLMGMFARSGVVDKNIAFCAFTGKAAHVLRSKLPGGSLVSTVHKLCFIPSGTVMCATTGDSVATCKACKKAGQKCTEYEITSWRLKPQLDPAIEMIVVDEASMIDDWLWRSLLSFGLPVLAVGDHFQLPAIGKDAGLMTNPNIRLEKVHRQALDSPVLKMATIMREYGELAFGDYGLGSMKLPRSDASMIPFDPDTWVLCGMNRTRLLLNDWQRKVRGFGEEIVMSGERIMNLKNDAKRSLFNGQTGVVTRVGEVTDDWVEIEARMDGDIDYHGRINRHQFRSEKTLRLGDTGFVKHVDQMTWNWAASVHKSQGSQSESVLLFEEHLPGTPEKHARWVYTGISRASDRVVVLSP